jgi:sulfide:quinone oxidoreductase
MAEFAAMGFKTVVCNRPDGEEAGQPTMAMNKLAAEKAGLVYLALPVSGMPTAEQGAAFAALLADAPSPVLAHCKSGGRSKVLVGMLKD